MPKITAIIFDLDGTLINTLQDIADSANHALTVLNLPTHPVDSFRHKVGDGARQTVSRCLDQNHQHLVDTMLPLQRAYYAEHCFDNTLPYPGIPEMLAEVKQNQFKLAVLSNKPDNFTQQIVTHFFGPDLFDLVRGQLPDGPLKPDSAAALDIARQFNIAPENFAFLGDTPTDILTARRADMLAIGAAWGFRDRTELLRTRCRQLIEHPDQLLPLLLPRQK